MIAKLKEQRDSIVAEMAGMLQLAEGDNRDFTAEEEASYNELEAQIKGIDKRMDRMSALEEASKKTVGQMSTLDHVAHRPVAPEAPKSFEFAGEWLASAMEAKLGRKVDSRLHWQEMKGEQSMGVGAEGGFMVPNELRGEMLKVDPAETPLLGRVRRWGPNPGHPDASETAPALNQGVNQHGGVTVGRVAEGGTKPETDFTLEQITWTPTELAAHIAMTEKIVRNWSAVQSTAVEMLRGAMNAQLENEIVRGAGGAQFTGFLGHPSSIEINRTVAGTFDFADMVNMSSRLLKRSGEAIWLINPALQADCMAMANVAGNLIWTPTVVDGIPGQLDGKPVFFHEFASAVGALGDVCLIKPEYYVLKEGSGPFVDFGVINNDFVQNRIRVKMFTNNDAQPWMTGPFTLANGIDTQSPFIVLDVP